MTYIRTKHEKLKVLYTHGEAKFQYDKNNIRYLCEIHAYKMSDLVSIQATFGGYSLKSLTARKSNFTLSDFLILVKQLEAKPIPQN